MQWFFTHLAPGLGNNCLYSFLAEVSNHFLAFFRQYHVVSVNSINVKWNGPSCTE